MTNKGRVCADSASVMFRTFSVVRYRVLQSLREERGIVEWIMTAPGNDSKSETHALQGE